MRPRLLRPDNFTPPARTPWGGRKILDRYKRELDLGAAASLPLVGESWEISVEPSFPCRFADDNTLLGQAICADPRSWLGTQMAARYGGQTPLLVKLLDAAASLSVQVHPLIHDRELGPDESGKIESWYILDAEAGAGLYLDFRDGVEYADVAACVRKNGPLDQLMNFVPVSPGDAFLIHAGTAHAVGAGITLVEPQLVVPGRRAVTYRYWDWTRRYDEHGRLSQAGTPRHLHVDRCLAVTSWHGPRGAAAVDACRCQPVLITPGSLARTRVIHSPHFEVERWAGTGVLHVPAQNTLLALVCVAGAATVDTASGVAPIRCGQSMVIAAACGAVEIRTASGQSVDLIVTR